MFMVLWEPQVQEGFSVLYEKESKHNKHAMVVYWNKELLSHRWTHAMRDCLDMLHVCFFTKHDDQIIGEMT